MDNTKPSLFVEFIAVALRRLKKSFHRNSAAPSAFSGSATAQGSFTLIELLIVIGILAVLVAAVVITLNPAQLLAQARDSQRQQDLSSLNQAINTALTLDNSLSLGTASTVYVSISDTTTTCASLGLPTLSAGWSYHCVVSSALRNTDGTGWVPVDLAANGVVGLSALPVDPINTTSSGFYYTYTPGGSFELSAMMESNKYKGVQSVAGLDGGRSWNAFEIGSNLTLTPPQLLDGHAVDASLVGWWPLNEGTGTIAYDQSGNNHNGTWSGTKSGLGGTYYTTSTRASSFAGYFNGSDNFVYLSGTAAMNLGSGARTVSVWQKTTNAALQYTVSKMNRLSANGFTGWSLGNDGANAMTNFYIIQNYGANQFEDSIEAVNLRDGVWHQLTAVYVPGSAISFYVDGTFSVGSSAGTLGTWNTDTSIARFEIGNRGTDNGTQGIYAPFYGLISDVRVYNRALSAAEVQALYNETK